MIGMKEFCALLLAGGMGAGSVVAVQQARPAASKPKASAAKTQKAAPRRTHTAQLNDCPVLAESPGLGILSPIIPPEDSPLLDGGRPGAGMALLPSPGPGFPGGIGGGGGFLPLTPPSPPGGPGISAPIPEPISWAMMVAGFGLVGLSLRRSGRPRDPEESPEKV
jgi:hypothetical protein